jgi:hypothetical protein
LLAVGASICGEDFAPDGGGESIQIKLPGLVRSREHLLSLTNP